MIKKICISSTSSLITENNLWKKKGFSVFFEDFGNLFAISKKNKINYFSKIKVIFFADLIDFFEEKSKNIIFLKKKIKKIAIMLNAQIISSEENLIYYSFYDQNQFKVENYDEIISELQFYFLSLIKKNKKNKNSLKLINLDNLFAKSGLEKNYDLRNYYVIRSRLSILGLKNLSNSIFSELKVYKKKKVLLLDCDNTLWGGVVGEDGYKKIILGNEGIGLIYKNFQKVVKKLIDEGIIVALISKNNFKDVENVLKFNDQMILKNKDIISFKVNWKEKYVNIIELSKELNLSTESFVFWDDNPIERKKVKMKVKNIFVVEPSKDISEWPRQLANLKFFKNKSFTLEDKNKTKHYQIRQKFENEKRISKNEIDYLKSINIRTKVHEINKTNILRAEQLCNKTNQFNLNLRRLKQSEILKLNKNKNFILKMISVKDDYGDHGIVCIFGISKNKTYSTIELLAMSCRVLGRYLENWVLNKMKSLSKKQKSKYIVAKYVKGPRNSIIQDYLKSNNFQPLYSRRGSITCKYNLNQKIKYLEIYDN